MKPTLLRKVWRNLGPGLTTGAADDDPSGIATYSQTGSQFGYQFLWLAWLTFPFMGVVQEMCARLGLVTGRGLAANTGKYFSRPITFLSAGLLFLANSLNLGADLGAMAASTRLLWPEANFILLVVGFALIILVSQIYFSYKTYASVLKLLTLSLLAYVLTAGFIDFNFTELLKHTFIPSFNFSSEQLFIVAAVFGTTISPYLFYWQTSQEVEEQILAGKRTVKARQEVASGEIKKMRTDVWVGMFISNIVMYFIIAVCAGTLFQAGIRDVATAEQAASALRPLAGNGAYLLFALGIIGTGMLAIPVLAGSASYAVAEAFKYKEGLFRSFSQAHAFYGVLISAVLMGIGINLLNLDPMKMLIYSAVFNALLAPLIIFQIIKLSSNPKVMGKYVNSRSTKLLGWLVFVIMFSISGFVIFSLVV